MVEVNAETDFVAPQRDVPGLRRRGRQDRAARRRGPRTRSAPRRFPGTGRTVADELTQLIATIGENMTIRRAARAAACSRARWPPTCTSAVAPGLGKIGVLVAIEGASEMAALETLGRQVGMHVAASRPEALDIDGVDPAALEREKAVLSEQARASGKPEAIIEKMVEGRIRKYYEETVLLEQVWVHDGESRVAAVLQKAGAKLDGFARFQLGEGIEKKADDFAAEVAAASGVKAPEPTT